MTPRGYRRYKLLRKVMIILAAAPLFQLAQCETGFNRIFASYFNALPSALFSSMLNTLIFLPLQLLLGATNSTGSGGVI